MTWMVLAMLLMGSVGTGAQVKKGTARPTIVTFVDSYLAIGEGSDEEEECDELGNAVRYAWQKYKTGQQQDEGTVVTVDVKNGYMSYEHRDEESGSAIKFEVCYWNCADGKHRLVAYNVYSFFDGTAGHGQYDGLMFNLYNNATGRLEDVQREDVGIDMGYGIDDPERGYDSTTKRYWARKATGETVYFREEEDWDEWLAWVRNNTTTNYVMLPRQGKDITMISQCGDRRKTIVWKWDGSRFHPQRD